MGTLVFKFLMIDNLSEAGKIQHTLLRHGKNILIIKIPLNLQQPQHPWIIPIQNVHANDAPGSAGLQFSLKLFQKISFNVFTFFQCEIAIAVDSENLWVGTENGLDIINIRTGEVRKFTSDFHNNHSLNALSVRSLCLDDKGICWLGMVGGGVNKCDKNLNLFNSVTSNIFDKKG